MLELIVRRPAWVLAAVVLATLAALPGIVDPRTGELRVVIDPAVDRLLPEEDPARVFYDRIQRLFGSDEAIVVALAADDVFTPEVLDRVVRLTRRLERVDGVQHVLSLATALNIRSVEGDIEIGPFLQQVPDGPQEARRLREEAFANPVYSGVLFSQDARATALLAYLDRMSDREFIERGIDDEVAAAAEELAGDHHVWISGGPHVKALISGTLLGELAFILPVTVLILTTVLAVAFRTVRGVVLPMGAIGLALVWTLGVLGWLGQELNLVTTIVPPLIMTVGFAYAMHVVADYYGVVRRHGPDGHLTPQEAVRTTLSEVGVPVVITALTTAAGFLALTLSPISAIRQFGLFAVLGVGFSLGAALTFAPAVLALLPLPGRRPEQERSPVLDRVAEALGRFAVSRRRWVIGSGLGLLVVAIIGMTQIRVATEFVGNFGLGSEIRQDYEAINARLAGANTLLVVLETDVPDAFLEPANLRELESLQAWLLAQEEIGHAASIVETIKLLNRALHDDDPEYFELPESRRMVGQLMLFGASNETERLTDRRYRTANLMIRSRAGDSQSMSRLVRRIERRLDALPEHLNASITGNWVLLTRSIDDVAKGQWQSILVAFVVIYIVLSLLFTSLRVGLVALFPNFLPIGIYFGALGFTGIPLNPWTSIVACLALGIAVDDTIHYFARFNADAKRTADERGATISALHALIRPVTFTTVGLCLGFLVLTVSDLYSQVQFGVLASFTLAVAWAVDVTLTPALCSGVRTVTLWDVLSLDLGAEPQRSIPLFGGLNTRQARIVALMSKMRTIPAGERLFAQGEQGADMYVVLDGSLAVSVTRADGRVDLAKLSRGDTVGEVGLFGAPRTADVDATSETRLIGFDAKDLERLRGRYPRIASVVYRNLNRIQASHFARTTRQLS